MDEIRTCINSDCEKCQFFKADICDGCSEKDCDVCAVMKCDLVCVSLNEAEGGEK